ncbi:MAG TPA: tRNA lysidine(34) synthetase TilS, partial [Candidatus Latescibacteria bacterium]|nr:tRNA lysidine(34) synthetase TilS [Candidatus Latescibacterota bacterium]
IASARDLPFILGTEEVGELARREGLSLEEAAREARYRFLERVCRNLRADRIALGHTSDDQAETVLMRLVRGGGRRGVGGMAPKRGKFVRPLLSVSREEVFEHLRKRGLDFVEDSTNRDTYFLRNKVRHILLPLLKESFNPRISEVLCREAEVLRDEDDYLESRAEGALREALREIGEGKVVLDIGELLNYHIAIRRRVVVSACRRLGCPLDFEVVERVLRLAEEGGFVELPGGVRAQASGGFLVLRRGKVPPFEHPLTVNGRTVVEEVGLEFRAEVVERPPDEVLREDGLTAYVDLDSVRGSLLVRNRLPGDRIRPFGMEGTRKVKDVLIDKKVPRLLRDEVPLVVDDEGVLWIVGVCLSERARVKEDTERVLCIKVNSRGQILHCEEDDLDER